MRRFSAILLSLALMLLQGGSHEHALAAPTATVSVVPASGTYSVGSNFTVAFQLNTGGQAVGGVDVFVTYSGNLQFVSFQTGSSVFSTDVINPSPSGNGFEFARVRLGTGFIVAAGNLLTVTFRPTTHGAATVNITQSTSEVIAYADSSNILQSVVNGAYAIPDPNPGGTTGSTGGSASGGGGNDGGSGGGGNSGGGGGLRRPSGQSSVRFVPPDPAPTARCSLAIITEGAPLPDFGGKLRMKVSTGEEITFRDVPTNQWFARYVGSVIQGRVASGYKDAQGNYTGLFGPANNVTYAETAKMLLNLAGKDAALTSGLPKNLTALGDWSQPYVKLMEDLGISVYSALPVVMKPATRGAGLQAAMEILGIPMGGASNPYRDVPANHKHASAILAATNLGIVSGDTDIQGQPKGTFRPDSPINRAEFSKIIVKLGERGCR